MAEEDPLPYRARPPQVLLAVGAVLVVCGGAALAGAGGGIAARLPLAFLAVPAAALSAHAARRGLRATGETLAACAAALALLAAWPGWAGAAGVAPFLAVGAGLLIMGRLAPATAAWPLGAWTAGQLAALATARHVPVPARPSLFLAVALAGLGTAWAGRRIVARLALVTTGPWWVAGVVGGTATAWTGAGAERYLAAALVVVAAAGLLPLPGRRDLDPFLGPRRLVPLVAGGVAGLGIAGAVAALGTAGSTAGGYAGVLLATVLPEFLPGGSRPFRAASVTAGSVLAGAALVVLLGGQRWAALSLLLLLTAAPTAVVAWWRPGERAAAVPAALGCLTAALVLTVPAGLLSAGAAAVLVAVLYGAGLLAAAELPGSSRRPTLGAAWAAAAVAVALTASLRDRDALALLLAAQGLLAVGWGVGTARFGAGRESSPAWRIGALQLTAAAEIGAHDAGARVLEAYTLPLALGLLLAAGPGLLRGPSWPAWGPGLLVAAVPSGLLAVLAAGSTRPELVLAAAAVVMVSAAAAGLRAPLLIGAGTAVGVTVGLAVDAQLWPLAAALAVGAGLLAVGARREQFPLARFGARVTDLR